MPLPTMEKKKIITAIGDLGRNVTAADVSAKTGLPILVVSQGLNEVAADTGGNMEVSSTGNIAYKFTAGFSTVYLSKGIKLFFQRIFDWIFKTGMFLLKISFGIMLILSLITVGILILVFILAVNKGSNSDNDFDFDFSFFDWMILRDLLFWGTMSYDPYDIEFKRTGRRKGNFLMNCFSFLFGDGNPNARIDERRWQQIAQVIRSNGNVVTSEQLAPYTGVDPKNENGVLPVLVRFNGKPEVTESGNIVYIFDSMQPSLVSVPRQDFVSYLKETLWKFTITPADDMIAVYIVAGLNFGGSWWLWHLVHVNPHLAGLTPLIALLVIYGTAFLVVPAVRFLVISCLNMRIEQRNDQREKLANALAKADANVQKKLKEAVLFRSRGASLEDDIVYTTEKDALEQKDDFEVEFEKKLKNKKS